jgi:hypothetical protein
MLTLDWDDQRNSYKEQSAVVDTIRLEWILKEACLERHEHIHGLEMRLGAPVLSWLEA